MNYAAIKTHDVANGPGVRVSLFVSGCTHYCKGCFNQEAWDFDYGQPFDAAAEEEILNALKPAYIKGFSLLGGEPFEPANQKALLPFMQRLRAMYPDKTVWCYTGYDLEKDFDLEKDLLTGRLCDYETTKGMLDCIDILVDGEFVEAKKDPNLRFRGSSNQRVIRLQETLKEDKIILWDDNEGLFEPGK